MGLDLLISAIAALPADQRPVLAIAGTGPERDELEALASTLGVRDDVRFLGRVPDEDLPALYAAGDLCVVPTRELEGFGYVALEAYAAGTPVIATAVGGLVDLVGGFDPAALVDPEPAAIAAAIAHALRMDTSDRESCRAYAATFDWDHIGPRVVEVFVEATTA
jgi:glycosyltransferase involved in cell wall biosynthesis